MVNFKLGGKYDKDEITNMTLAWNEEKSLSPRREFPSFFFVSRSCHVGYFIFVTVILLKRAT